MSLPSDSAAAAMVAVCERAVTDLRAAFDVSVDGAVAFVLGWVIPRVIPLLSAVQVRALWLSCHDAAARPRRLPRGRFAARSERVGAMGAFGSQQWARAVVQGVPRDALGDFAPLTDGESGRS